MNGTSRKPMKNPLLSGAGPGFPFDNYAENTLLVPVTPATPAVLRDDVELDSFIGQKPAHLQSESPSKTHENSPTNVSSQSKENKDTIGQPTKSGYLTSILSSLPNLSLSSSKTEFTGSQISQTTENIGGASHESNPYIPPQGRYGSQQETPEFLAINPQDPPSAKLSGFAAFGPSGTVSNPPQPAIPPNLPQSGYTSVSYRLGNQRRLKYAPPPDLTSNNAKTYSSPAIQTFFPTQNISAPTILNPYQVEGSVQSNDPSVQQIGSLPEARLSTQLSTPEQLSRNSSIHSSFRSSPITTTTAFNSSATLANQNSLSESSAVSVPAQFTSSLSRPIPARVLEPTTPQNTPANVSFSGFAPYQDLLSTSNLDTETIVPKNVNTINLSPEFLKSGSLEPIAEPAYKSSLISRDTEATFAPISAAKVTEKLEHLLAEQKETSPGIPTSGVSSEVDEVASSLAIKSAINFESRNVESREALQAANESIDKTYETKSNNDQGKVVESGSDIWSDVFLGQEPTAQSVIPSKVRTADNVPFVTDLQAASSSSHPLQQHYQVQSISAASPASYADKPAEQKSSLNYIPPVQYTQQSSNLYNPSKSAGQSASVFFESTKPDQFPSSSSQKGNINLTLGQSITDGASINLQRAQENSTLNSTAIDSMAQVPHWNADRSSQSQVLNVTTNQLAYNALNPPIYTAPSQQSAPIFYNLAQFANEPKQTTFSHTNDPRSPQQQPYQNPPFYSNTSGPQQPYDPRESNIAYPPPTVSMTTVPELTGSATLSPVQISVNAPTNRTTPDTLPPSFQNLASGSTDRRTMQYNAIYHHWFYRKEVENKTLWVPFSMPDSLKLEKIYNSSDITPETTVATDGGRYDVDILHRQRAPVYWTGASNEVRRCSWFFKGSDSRYVVPYSESIAVKLEEEYKQACLTNSWNRRIDLNNGEYIVFHSATDQVHYLQPSSTESTGSWGNAGSEDSTYLQGTATIPRVVKRGVDECNIDIDGEPENVDHLLFLVHGIGSVCDLKFRSIEEVVDEFRSISLRLVQSHYRTASEQRIVNRIEVLPISWHTKLHSDETGIDKKLQAITLESIPKLRYFTNDTLLDILFYTSPMYCQTIMNTVGSEMNRLHALFKERNPSFDGEIYLGGHSLGSLIMFDLLRHQKPIDKETENGKEDDDTGSEKGSDDVIEPMRRSILKRRLSKRISYVMGAAGTGQPYIHYPQLNFYPRAFFALGSPIGMFVTVRGIDILGENFVLPTCPAFFNIFHPFDPVAYRVESLINPEACKFRPMLIPHHKGRKRMHLELKETIERVGADLKQKLIDSVRQTWNSLYQLAPFYKTDNQALNREIDKVVEEQLQQSPSIVDQQNNDDNGADLRIGRLNGGRRIDYVLQEAPFEYINEYIFALTSHICYWESEDTMLLILKEIYGSNGIQTDAQLPQQTLSVERMSSSQSLNLSAATSSRGNNSSDSNRATPTSVMGIDPTVPMSSRAVGPPPKTGFVPKS